MLEAVSYSFWYAISIDSVLCRCIKYLWFGLWLVACDLTSQVDYLLGTVFRKLFFVNGHGLWNYFTYTIYISYIPAECLYRVNYSVKALSGGIL